MIFENPSVSGGGSWTVISRRQKAPSREIKETKRLKDENVVCCKDPLLSNEFGGKPQAWLLSLAAYVVE